MVAAAMAEAVLQVAAMGVAGHPAEAMVEVQEEPEDNANEY